MNPENLPHGSLPHQPRHPYDWPLESERLVRQKQRLHPSHLVEQLHAITGYPMDACWRYAHKFGIKRPTRYHRWPERDREKVLEMSETRPVPEIAKHFGVSAKAIYHVIEKSERRVSRRSEWFGLHAVAKYLTVKPARIRSWIAAEKLKCVVETHGQLRYTLISGAELAKFCKTYKGELLRQRIPEKRIQFLVDYVIAAEMPDDYTARSSKLERAAFARGEYLERPEIGSNRSFTKEVSEEDVEPVEDK